MKTFLTLAIGLIVAACSTPATPVLLDTDPTIHIDRVETFTGVEATRKTLEAVARELRDHYALTTAATAAGQTPSERLELLEEMVQSLEQELLDHEMGAASPACVVHANPTFTSRFTSAWIGHGVATIGALTATDRTTQIRNSVYSLVGRGSNPGADYARGRNTPTDLACGDRLFSDIRLTYSIDLARDARTSIWLYAETAHMLPTTPNNSISWTTDTAWCNLPIIGPNPRGPLPPLRCM